MIIDGLEYSLLVQILFSYADYPIKYKRDYLEIAEFLVKLEVVLILFLLFIIQLQKIISKKI